EQVATAAVLEQAREVALLRAVRGDDVGKDRDDEHDRDDDTGDEPGGVSKRADDDGSALSRRLSGRDNCGEFTTHDRRAFGLKKPTPRSMTMLTMTTMTVVTSTTPSTRGRSPCDVEV